MGVSELVSLIALGTSTAFGFGMQYSTIKKLERDLNAMGKRNDNSISPKIDDISNRLTKIESMIEFYFSQQNKH
jgi:hypothetical protein